MDRINNVINWISDFHWKQIFSKEMGNANELERPHLEAMGEIDGRIDRWID